ncbi:PEGA domain-containing protein [Thermococcus indicus]|uniref:PEGA domain-containing protein n=1 Tax=Thermococcus indicus TaxID=2586643 RepID=A0A4Y5SN25_9EURY|nr:PEGA domain-containing protein [Thermococcus indicus]QDA31599.1 PEGA domain-containing protein [Thermococcus indicus]
MRSFDFSVFRYLQEASIMTIGGTIMRKFAVYVFIVLLTLSFVTQTAAEKTVDVLWSAESASHVVIREALNQVILASGSVITVYTLNGEFLWSRDLGYPIEDVELERNSWELNLYVASGKFIHVFYRDGRYARFAAPDSLNVLKVQPAPWVDRVLLLLSDGNNYYVYITDKGFTKVYAKLPLGTRRPIVGMTYDGNYIIICSGGKINVKKISTGSEVWSRELNGTVESLTVGTDKVYISLSGEVPMVIGLSLKDGQYQFSTPLLGDPVSMSFDWGEQYIVVGQRDGRVTVLSGSRNVLWEGSFRNNFGTVKNIAISRSGRYIAVAFEDKTVIFINEFVPTVKFSVEDNGAELIKLFTAKVEGTINAVDINDDGTVLAVLSYYLNPAGGSVDFISEAAILSSAGRKTGSKTFNHVLRDIAVSGNGNYIAITGDDHYLHVLNTKGDEVANRFFDFYSGGAYTVAISEDGSRIAVGTFAGWTDKGMTEVANASLHYFTFDGSTLRERWKRVFPSPTWGTRVWGISMDYRGDLLAVSVDGGYNNTLIFSSNGKALWESGERGYIYINKNGKIMVYLPLPGDGIIRVQNITGGVLWTKRVSGVVVGFKFSRDFLVACLRDDNRLISTLRVFSIKNGTEVLRATFPGLVSDFAVSWNNYLLLGYENGTVEYYKIESSFVSPASMATLEIHSFPTNARVFVDGSYKGNTPLTLKLEEGTYSIAIEKIGYSRWTSTIRLLAGEAKTLNVTLNKVAIDTASTLEVDSTPSGAKVYINGEYAGVTPVNLTLEAGDYEVKLVKYGYLDWIKTVSLTAGSSEKISAILSEANGILEVTSEPDQAKVYVNGDYRGLTPLQLTLPPGNYTVRVIKDGYEDAVRNTTVKSGEKTSINVKLSALSQNMVGGIQVGGTTLGTETLYYLGGGVLLAIALIVLFMNRKFKEIEEKTTGKAIEEFAPRPTSQTTFPQELSNKYTDVEFIGKGGFARVFKAKRVNDGKVVAIKVPISLDEATGKSFVKELQNWAGLKHQNIVEIYDYNILPVPYIEMEYCEGNLEKEEKPMDVRKAAWLIFNIAEGLKYAHSKSIIHRDLKPSNILLKQGIPKVSDWGLSKVMTSSRSSTMAGFTPLYAAPEQISKKFGETDERTDIWQLGVVFYELVTGKLPFEARDFVELASKITTEDPLPPSDINPEAKDVEHIIMKMLSKDKELRYRNMLELQRDLAIYLGMSMKEELRKSTTVGDKWKVAFYLGDLLLMSMKVGNKVDSYKYATDLLEYVKGEVRTELEQLVQQLKMRLEEGLDIPPELVDKAELIVHKIKLRRGDI